MRSSRTKNQRQYVRKPVKASMQLLTESAGGDLTITEARCLDVSQTGLQMNLWLPVEPRDRVTVRVDKLKIHTNAYVRHCQRDRIGYTAGVEFSNRLRKPVE